MPTGRWGRLDYCWWLIFRTCGQPRQPCALLQAFIWWTAAGQGVCDWPNQVRLLPRPQMGEGPQRHQPPDLGAHWEGGAREPPSKQSNSPYHDRRRMGWKRRARRLRVPRLHVDSPNKSDKVWSRPEGRCRVRWQTVQEGSAIVGRTCRDLQGPTCHVCASHRERWPFRILAAAILQPWDGQAHQLAGRARHSMRELHYARSGWEVRQLPPTWPPIQSETGLPLLERCDYLPPQICRAHVEEGRTQVLCEWVHQQRARPCGRGPSLPNDGSIPSGFTRHSGSHGSRLHREENGNPCPGLWRGGWGDPHVGPCRNSWGERGSHPGGTAEAHCFHRWRDQLHCPRWPNGRGLWNRRSQGPTISSRRFESGCCWWFLNHDHWVDRDQPGEHWCWWRCWGCSRIWWVGRDSWWEDHCQSPWREGQGRCYLGGKSQGGWRSQQDHWDHIHWGEAFGNDGRCSCCRKRSTCQGRQGGGRHDFIENFNMERGWWWWLQAQRHDIFQDFNLDWGGWIRGHSHGRWHREERGCWCRPGGCADWCCGSWGFCFVWTACWQNCHCWPDPDREKGGGWQASWKAGRKEVAKERKAKGAGVKGDAQTESATTQCRSWCSSSQTWRSNRTPRGSSLVGPQWHGQQHSQGVLRPRAPEISFNKVILRSEGTCIELWCSQPGHRSHGYVHEFRCRDEDHGPLRLLPEGEWGPVHRAQQWHQALSGESGSARLAWCNLERFAMEGCCYPSCPRTQSCRRGKCQNFLAGEASVYFGPNLYQGRPRHAQVAQDQPSSRSGAWDAGCTSKGYLP